MHATPLMRTVAPLLLLMAGLVLVPNASAASETKSFGDWGLHCGKQRDAEPDNCFLSQSVSHRKSGGTLLHIAIGRPAGSKQLRALLTVPLGVLLTPGIGLKIDDGELHQADFLQCLDHGCSANLSLDEALLTELKEGKVAGVAAVGPDTKPIVVPFSLQGLEQGLQHLAPTRGSPSWSDEISW